MTVTLRRFTDWPGRLSAFLAEKEREAFAWGRNDCCLFTADAVAALTGVDPAADWRGAYDNEDAAQVLLDAAGGLARLVTAALGSDTRQLVGFARRGDLVLAAGAVGVVDDTGARVALYARDRGLVRAPLRLATVAWRVG